MGRNEEVEHPGQYCIVELQVLRHHFTRYFRWRGFKGANLHEWCE